MPAELGAEVSGRSGSDSELRCQVLPCHHVPVGEGPRQSKSARTISTPPNRRTTCRRRRRTSTATFHMVRRTRGRTWVARRKWDRMPPKKLGLYDIHGNVYQWCATCTLRGLVPGHPGRRLEPLRRKLPCDVPQRHRAVGPKLRPRLSAGPSSRPCDSLAVNSLTRG